MRLVVVTVLSTLLSALVVSNAYMEKKQFYPTVVYLLTSNRSLGVMYLQGFVMVWFLCKFLKTMFFGTLRAAEVEHLIESSWYAILETFILLAAFHQELSVGFVAMVTLLFVAKSFHWLANDRVDFMERSPMITWVFHIRAVSLFFLLLIVDYLFVKHAWSTLQSKGFSVDIVFGLEYAIMFLSALSSGLHYLLHTIDRQSEDPWENKPIYMRLVNIVLGFFELVLYIGYMAFMLYVLFIPLHIARRVYVTAKNFQKSIHDVIASQQAIRHLNTLYPDASVEELEAVNNVCVICREEMVTRCKKLPCGHIFHTACLQSWFQRQQICPTCRMEVLNRVTVNRLVQGHGQQPQNPAQHQHHQQQQQQQQPAPPPFQRQQQQQQQQQQPFNPQQNNGFIPPMMFPPPMMPPMWPHPPQAQPADQPEGGNPPPASQAERPAEGTDGAIPPPPTAAPGAPQAPNGAPQFPMGYPGFPGPFPFPPPPPVGFMPPGFGTGPLTGASLQSLSSEQLQQLEGMERANVEARITVLRDVQKLLDSAVLRLNQYSAVMSVISPPAGPGFPGYPFPPPPAPPDSTASTASASTQSLGSERRSGGSGEGGLFQPPGDGAVGRGQEPTTAAATSSGLFQSPSSTSQEGGGIGVTVPLQDPTASGGGGGVVQSENIRPKEAPAMSDASVVDEAGSAEPRPSVSDGKGDDGELVLSKSSSHVDAEIRQRRLDRLHSMPSTSQQSLSPLLEETAWANSGGAAGEGPAGAKPRTGTNGEDGSTEV